MDIEAIKKQIESDIQNISSSEGLEEARFKYLGRKGVLAQLTATIPSLPAQERAVFGQQANILKDKIANLILEKEKLFGSPASGAMQESVDIGMPGVSQEVGKLHPITRVIDEICNIFLRMGFQVVEGPEIETEYNNFSGLNIPLEHPSRDAFDTFYLKDYEKLLLRSHTSPVQVRAMKSRKPPLAIVVPGRVYRPDAVDASHLFMFNQIEGLMVDEGIKFSDLKGILEVFARSVFGEDIKMRFRPHFFPFTEPSAEVDISCIICKGRGCPVCGRKGWLEILGSGMIHPNVLRNVGYDTKKYSGFAFGMGIERIVMLKYGINDIRLFFENDLRFLRQF
ncbi:MAG: phenylalanine--tRNA ligase subunit alpha [Candidatus Omnitrophota bacterium]|nr:phenylalanine--tRNA ligase subunit alpha [Candidatus Omnitrophota bacterium]MBU1929003.1 phenylalanine--tRNA ligase subunit alpha [Candidatus Omnitrophota bacterium]MBU2035682.1 phenylalanine--tRNA ligase subunit alpha [Candidatus Omnitrophota bacterium]MBU2221066.1 phenylalanine--tRNA ligase subunit alpha [Candidatus Omnitrophota bacterium]MBU2258846.1 phenylalanine--tRNA ligase subunit alpha [Candidatus Omnitrophota bacterium]